jgi:O-antigen/teichoic acid export membrane protein
MLENFKNNTYLKQIITLMSGSLMAQIIMLGSIPILTRLYTPSEFGIYSLFISIITIVGNISSLMYEQAIMLPKNDKDANALLFLSFIFTIITSIISFLIVIIFYPIILNYFNNNITLVYLLPIGVLFIGILQILNAYTSRNQFYKTMSKARVINAVNLSFIQVSTRYFGNFDGLVLGKLIADFINILYFINYHIKRNTIQLKNISKRRKKFNINKYHHFPKFQTPTVFLNSISQNIPILLLGYLYSAEVAGYYALTIRVLQAPINLIGASTREVFYQKASKMHANKENFFNLYYKTTINLFKLFLIPLLIISIFGEEIYSSIFGEKWSTAGIYSQILIYWILFLFINSPSIMSFSILNLQKIQMYIEIASAIFRFSSIILGFYIFNSVIYSLIFFMITSVLVNLFVIIYIYLKLKKRLFI